MSPNWVSVWRDLHYSDRAESEGDAPGYLLPETPFFLHIKLPARQRRRHLRAVISCLPKLCQEGWSRPFFVHALVVALNKALQKLQPALIHKLYRPVCTLGVLQRMGNFKLRTSIKAPL